MLTDDEVRERALAHIRRFGDDLRLSRPVVLDELGGVFYKVERPVSSRSTNLVNPFFVGRGDGKITTVSAGDVMPGIVTKLWGWSAMRADPELQKAVVDPDFEKPRHVEVWSAIIREVVTRAGGAAPQG